MEFFQFVKGILVVCEKSVIWGAWWGIKSVFAVDERL